jgi:hypothetical protein
VAEFKTEISGDSRQVQGFVQEAGMITSALNFSWIATQRLKEFDYM